MLSTSSTITISTIWATQQGSTLEKIVRLWQLVSAPKLKAVIHVNGLGLRMTSQNGIQKRRPADVWSLVSPTPERNQQNQPMQPSTIAILGAKIALILQTKTAQCMTVALSVHFHGHLMIRSLGNLTKPGVVAKKSSTRKLHSIRNL